MSAVVDARARDPRPAATVAPLRSADGEQRILLVEDDDGDALLFSELLSLAGAPFPITHARTMGEAVPLAAAFDCAVVDLGLPDAAGLDALTTLRSEAPHLAIVVLTGLRDRSRAIAAVSGGAQDYLVKGEVDGDGLARAIRYSIERFRADEATKQLLVTEQRQAENARLARGLLPHPAIDGAVSVHTRYRPGADALLGGDFFLGGNDERGHVTFDRHWNAEPPYPEIKAAVIDALRGNLRVVSSSPASKKGGGAGK